MAMVDVHKLTDNSGIANARLALREVVDVFTRRAALTKVGAEEASSAVEIQKVEEEFTRALVRLKEQCSLVESSTTTIATIDEQTMLQDNDEQLILRDQLIETAYDKADALRNAIDRLHQMRTLASALLTFAPRMATPPPTDPRTQLSAAVSKAADQPQPTITANTTTTTTSTTTNTTNTVTATNDSTVVTTEDKDIQIMDITENI